MSQGRGDITMGVGWLQRCRWLSGISVRGVGFGLVLSALGWAQTLPWKPLPAAHWDWFSIPEQARLMAFDEWIMARYAVGDYALVEPVIGEFMEAPGHHREKVLLALYVRFGKRWELARHMLRGLDPSGANQGTRFWILANFRDSLTQTGRTYVSPKDRCRLSHYVTSGIESDVACLLEACACLTAMEDLWK